MDGAVALVNLPPMILWTQQNQQVEAENWRTQLRKAGQPLDIQMAEEPFSARWLRCHPELALLLDEQGLWLSANGMRMQPDWWGEWPRLKRATCRGELLARACGLGQGQPVRVLDATAGLAHDALLLAVLGASVTAIERHPVVLALLQDEWRRAQQYSELAPALARLKLVHAQSGQWLAWHERQDVVYVDPMFPGQSFQSAKVKKPMQLMHALLQEQRDEPDVLLRARQVARRVVVKRPRHAAFLEDQAADHQWLGEAVRFDGYFQPENEGQDEASCETV